MPFTPNAVALVAEDEPLVRMETADILADAGFEVLEASTAPAALACLEEGRTITLLFTDVLMPGAFDGLALAYKVRRRWTHLPIVIVSGNVALTAAQMPDNARFLPKPYYARALARLIHDMGVCGNSA
ncbi:MAG: response regulator [Methylorubrum rhodinum]|uniref:response regulator n=1 Tax=Methylorubrum rhodinum TaxID=29428 RepID=UPI003BB0B796